jgi:hypothetical protein
MIKLWGVKHRVTLWITLEHDKIMGGILKSGHVAERVLTSSF